MQTWRGTKSGTMSRVHLANVSGPFLISLFQQPHTKLTPQTDEHRFSFDSQEDKTVTPKKTKVRLLAPFFLTIQRPSKKEARKPSAVSSNGRAWMGRPPPFFFYYDLLYF